MNEHTKFKGTGVAMITPFTENGSVDYNRLEHHVDQLIQHDVSYLVALGTTAETPTLSHKERLEIIRVVQSANSGRLPLVVGAGGNNTEEVISWSREIGSDGIDALLSVAPYYNKPGQQGMIEHFSAIAAASEVPVILYNVPGRTGSNITADTVLTLATDQSDKIVAVKEASGDFGQIMEIIRQQPEGFGVLSGDDALTLPMIAAGAVGVISVIANALPQHFSVMVNDALSGDLGSARQNHYALLPLIKAIFREGNPTGVKALMELRGFGKANLRLPLIPATRGLVGEIADLLNAFEA
jgi:4-hydroxy-tetrahydrodipicolinate synthase